MFPTATALRVNQPRSREGPLPWIFLGLKVRGKNLGTKLQVGFDCGFIADLKERPDRASYCLNVPKFEARLF